MAVTHFEVILGDSTVRIGDHGVRAWERDFSTGDVSSSTDAILMLMVRGLTATSDDADVRLNRESIGKIYANRGADPNHWTTQIINIGKGKLNSGRNTLEIEGVLIDAGPGDHYDDFWVRDIVCFFHRRES